MTTTTTTNTTTTRRRGQRQQHTTGTITASTAAAAATVAMRTTAPPPHDNNNNSSSNNGNKNNRTRAANPQHRHVRHRGSRYPPCGGKAQAPAQTPLLPGPCRQGTWRRSSLVRVLWGAGPAQPFAAAPPGGKRAATTPPPLTAPPQTCFAPPLPNSFNPECRHGAWGRGRGLHAPPLPHPPGCANAPPYGLWGCSRKLDCKPQHIAEAGSQQHPQAAHKAGRKLLCGGGGGDTEAHFPNPPPPASLAAVTGGGVQGGGARPAVPGGGGVNPTSMAQNDTHVALIILTTQMWGGIIGGKNFFGPKFVFLRLRRQHPFLDKTKGPTRNPISPTPPPPPSAGVHVTPPPPRRAIFRSPNGTHFTAADRTKHKPCPIGAREARSTNTRAWQSPAVIMGPAEKVKACRLQICGAFLGGARLIPSKLFSNSLGQRAVHTVLNEGPTRWVCPGQKRWISAGGLPEPRTHCATRWNKLPPPPPVISPSMS